MQQSHPRSHFKAVIFDLDDTLADETDLGDTFFNPAFDAIRGASKGYLADERLVAAFSACWHTSFDAVSKAYGFSAEMTQVGHAAFAKLEVDPNHRSYKGYSDIDLVRELPARRYLVTSGYRALQESKVKALGIETWFDKVVIEAANEARQPGKQAIFEDIRKAGLWKAAEVLIVGDNPNSEIAAGNKLGMVTVQALRPRVECSGAAVHHILHLCDLWPIMGMGLRTAP